MSYRTRRILTTLLGVLLLLAAGAADGFAAAAETADQKAVRARRDAFEKAIAKRDAKGAAAFLDKSFTMTSGGQKLNYEQSIAVLNDLAGLPEGAAFSSEIEKIVVTGTSAKVTVTDNVTLTGPDGKKVVNGGRSVEVWKKIGGKWVMVKSDEL